MRDIKFITTKDPTERALIIHIDKEAVETRDLADQIFHYYAPPDIETGVVLKSGKPKTKMGKALAEIRDNLSRIRVRLHALLGSTRKDGESSEVLLCPFCGHPPQITKHFKEEMWSLTHRCRVIGPMTIDWSTEKKTLLMAWNRRFHPPAAQTAKLAERAYISYVRCRERAHVLNSATMDDAFIDGFKAGYQAALGIHEDETQKV